MNQGIGQPLRSVLRAVLPPLLALGLLTSAGCGAHYVRTGPPSGAQSVPESERLTNHVLLISIDGLRPDAIATYQAATLERLIQEGSYTLSATTILPSKTLPSHTSMLTGEPPERHGVLWNITPLFSPERIQLPTVFSALRGRGYRTASFFSKSKFQHLQRPGTLDYSQAPGGWFGFWPAARTVQDVERYLGNEQPHLLFVHLADTDRAGHDSGWMSKEYGSAVVSVDVQVSRLLGVADRAWGKGNYTVIVTADHGGHDKDHGSNDPRDLLIPWIVWGRGVEPGRISESVTTTDTASTVLWLLGVSEPADWAGTPVTTAFRPINVVARPLDIRATPQSGIPQN
jgi:arylsulfatase A-like enzyme